MGLVGAELTRWEREHPRWPHRQTVRAHFGSWRAAITEAGFPGPPPLHGTVIERITAARRLANEGESVASIAEHLGVHVNTVRNYLKSTRCPACGDYKVVDTADLCLSCSLRASNAPAFDQAAVIKAMRDWTRETGRRPIRRDWTPTTGAASKWRAEWPRWPSASQVSRLFGTWIDATKQAGVTSSQQRYPDDELLAALRAEAKRLGRPPTAFEWRTTHSAPSLWTLVRRFGSWCNALEAARLETSGDTR
jgi:hypothetical protein